ncbi:unnamed protein product [Symbiodinium sp. CCMP2456]|nr:unnamed protein product [Symbiodinium sp. CCMP2456]
MGVLRLIPLLCLALGEHCSESSDKASLLQTKALVGEEAQLSKSLSLLPPRTLHYSRFRRRRHKGLLPFVYIRINVAVDDSNREDVLTKLREQETEFFINFFAGIIYANGVPYKANLRILKTTSTQVQFQVGFIPDLRFKFGVVDPKATLRATVWELDRLLRGPEDNVVRTVRYNGGVVGGFFFEGRLLVQAANVSYGKPLLWYVKADSPAYGYGHYGHGSTNFLPANVSFQGNAFVWELRRTYLTTFQGHLCLPFRLGGRQLQTPRGTICRDDGPSAARQQVPVKARAVDAKKVKKGFWERLLVCGCLCWAQTPIWS